MSQIVVSDSTCPIALERIGRLDLLLAVFEQIWVPPAVAAYEMAVDAGEAAAIALAAELKCEVILDDLQARRLATREGVRCWGCSECCCVRSKPSSSRR